MDRPGIPSRSFTRLLGLAAMPCLALTLASCTGEQPKTYRLGETIQIGEFQLRPTHTETAATQTAPGPGPKIRFVVFIRCTGGNRFNRMDLNREFFDRQAIELVDERGRTYDFFSLGGGDTYSDWAAQFYVPADSRGLRLRLENIVWREGQPKRVEVPLGQ